MGIGMKSIFRKKSNFLYSAVSVLLVNLLLAGCVNFPKESHAEKLKSAWEIVDGVMALKSFENKKIYDYFGTPFSASSSSTNFNYWEGNLIKLGDGVVIPKILLRTPKNTDVADLLLIDFEGPCIPKKELRSRFAELKVEVGKRGHGEMDSTLYVQYSGWGRITFEFMDRNPGCLVSVSFHPKEIPRQDHQDRATY
ncbi:hypothetical protein GCM10010946_20390 [Undibacterium squillarum]|nr:hypothetical protein GCM10010946_20390 [Undibacterium squillarum]